MTTLWFALLIAGAYLLGSIPTAFLVARWRRGIDLRRHGSGNIGVSNVVAAGSRWSSLIVIVVDLGKGIVPVLAARQIDLPTFEQVVVGLAAICGHNWTVFLKFNGGRGVLTTVGVIFALAPWLAPVLTVIAFAFLPFGLFSVGVLFTLLLLPLLSWFFAGTFQIERSVALTSGFLAMTVLLLLRRLTAKRTDLSATVSTGELIANRLLFDRDIHDRKAWIKRSAASSGANGDVTGVEEDGPTRDDEPD